MAIEVISVLSAFPDVTVAGKIARTLVEERLVACANIITNVESIYRWKGKVESNAEVLVIFKTMRARYPELEQRLRKLHPYELPEIVAMDFTAGLTAYLDWVAESVMGG